MVSVEGEAVEGSAFELAWDAPPARRVSQLSVLHDDKAVFDALQAWCSWRRGRRVTQWEMFTLLLAEALEREGGRLAGAVPHLRRARAPPARRPGWEDGGWKKSG